MKYKEGTVLNAELLIRNFKKSLNLNSPKIFTVAGVFGVITTSYLAARASYKAAVVITEDEKYFADVDVLNNRKELYKHRAKLTWKLFIPPISSGLITIGCITGLSSVTSRRAAAAATLYTLTEKNFDEYKNQVQHQFGKNKEQKITDAIAQEKVNKTSEVVYVGKGLVLCCELHTGRFFRSDMELLKNAENELNARLLSDIYVSLSEFYSLVGLPTTSISDYVGWSSGKQVELLFSTTLSTDSEPCLAFDYNYINSITTSENY